MRKVQVWLYARRNGEKELQILLFKTCPERGEFWQPVTGGVEKAERFEDAALREVFEETGIVATAERLTRLSSFEFEGKWGKAFEQGFGLELPEKDIGRKVELDPKEHTDFQWLSAADAMKKTHFESNRKILTELISKTR
jgi:dihydroneopterin triphosphate diphosphatase